MLQINRISKTYNAVEVLKDVTLTLPMVSMPPWSVQTAAVKPPYSKSSPEDSHPTAGMLLPAGTILSATCRNSTAIDAKPSGRQCFKPNQPLPEPRTSSKRRSRSTQALANLGLAAFSLDTPLKTSVAVKAPDSNWQLCSFSVLKFCFWTSRPTISISLLWNGSKIL